MAELFIYDEQPVVQRGNDIVSVRLTPTPLDDQSFVMGITSFPPGAVIPLHSHNTVEQVTVLEGEGVVHLNGEDRPARRWDTTQIPPGEIHQFRNEGNERMTILWVYGSTHVTRTFAETGETVDQFGRPS